MPQLDPFYFLSETTIALIVFYTIVYFYLLCFSRQNYEFWLVTARLNHYYERNVIYQATVNAQNLAVLNVSLLDVFGKETIHKAWEEMKEDKHYSRLSPLVPEYINLPRGFSPDLYAIITAYYVFILAHSLSKRAGLRNFERARAMLSRNMR